LRKCRKFGKENTDNRDSRDNPNNSDNQNFLKILGAALPKPPDKLIPVPASEYKTLIACRVVLETIFASMDENGYTSSGAVRAAKDVFNLYT
jgi:hypothetical protein